MAGLCWWLILYMGLMELLLAAPTGGASRYTWPIPRYLSPNLKSRLKRVEVSPLPHAGIDSTAPNRDSPSGESQGSQQEPSLDISGQGLDQ